MKFLCLSAACAIVFASSAQAADLLIDAPPAAEPAASAGQFYVSGFGSASFLRSLDYTGSNGSYGQTFLDTGYGLTGAVGYDFGNGLSVEAQIGYLTANQTGATYTGPGLSTTVPVTGTASAFYGMLNAWYGVDLGGVTPFVGGGIGLANQMMDSTYTGPIFAASTFSDSEITWAAQLGAGVEIALADNLDLVGRYRYFTTGSVSFVDGQGTTLTSSYGTHLVDVGLKLSF